MNRERFGYIEAHIDAGGKISHENGIELFNEVVKLRKALDAQSLAESLLRSPDCNYQKWQELEDEAARLRVAALVEAAS